MIDARFLLASIAQKRFCNIHYHHTRHAMIMASQYEPSCSGDQHGFCVLFHKGCSGTGSNLPPLSMYRRHALQDTESFHEFHESVSVLSVGLLTDEEVCGRYACGACRYIVSKGALGTRPTVDFTHLLDAVDRFLAECVLNALCVSNTQSVFISENEAASQEAQRLRKKVAAPFPNVPRSRFFPVREVFKSRLNLVEQSGSISRNVCNKTIESRLGPVLSAKNVHLYSFSRKLRYYAPDSALPDTVQSVISLSSGDDVSILLNDRRMKFNEVCRRFVDDDDIYRTGKWFLSEEITVIPKQLWASVVLVMSSNKKLASWKVAASESGKKLSELFPVCNDREQLPISDLDNFAHRSLHRSEYLHCIPRCEFVLCLRALKFIEQIAFSRSRLAIGPPQMNLSIAGILETAASWTSVLHALVIVTSYDSTERLRKRLVAEREQSCEGAFENVQLQNRLTTVQMNNFYIHPLHLCIA